MALFSKKKRAAKTETTAGTTDPPAATTENAATTGTARQAIIIVHGMGEQRPMDTLKSFVATLWRRDPAFTPPGGALPNESWSKPDGRAGSLELRRIATRSAPANPAFAPRVRSDFYELYWADTTAGSTWRQFRDWLRYLLLRPWRRVPRDVRLAWIFLWILTLVSVAALLLAALPEAYWARLPLHVIPRFVYVALVGAVSGFVTFAIVRSFGRVVRYTRADPDNIAARAAARARGLALLRALHEPGEEAYDRVILAAHSLGCILAYDILSHFWAERTAAQSLAPGSEAFRAALAVDRAAADLRASAPPPVDARTRYREAQADLRRVLARRHGPARWLISDFVTFGCPLTHAEFLIAHDEADLAARQAERELPTCPPVAERLDPRWHSRAARDGVMTGDGRDSFIIYPHPDRADWLLHHGAPFAAVRWTNVSDRSRLVAMGDLISGPVAPIFGWGIEDTDLADVRGPSRRFSHTLYWAPDADFRQLAVVRAAVNLRDD